MSRLSKRPLREFAKFFINLQENNEKDKKELEIIIKEDDALITEYNIIEEDIDNMRENNNYMEDEIDNFENMIYNKKEDIKKQSKKNNNNVSSDEKKLIEDLAAIKAKIMNTNSELETECDIIIEKIINAFKEFNKTANEIKELNTNIKKFKLVINKINKKKSIVKKNHDKLLAKVNTLKANYNALK